MGFPSRAVRWPARSHSLTYAWRLIISSGRPVCCLEPALGADERNCYGQAAHVARREEASRALSGQFERVDQSAVSGERTGTGGHRASQRFAPQGQREVVRDGAVRLMPGRTRSTPKLLRAFDCRSRQSGVVTSSSHRQVNPTVTGCGHKRGYEADPPSSLCPPPLPG
jgi:hypothetical protein